MGTLGTNAKYINSCETDPMSDHIVSEDETEQDQKKATCAFGEVTQNGVPFPFVFAKRKIMAGEELILYYGSNYFGPLRDRVREHRRIHMDIKKALGIATGDVPSPVTPRQIPKS
jgi:hypothetical protein